MPGEDRMPQLPTFTQGHLSIIDLFVSADWIVKTILAILLLMSVTSWAVIIGRSMIVRRERHKTQSIESVLQMVESIDDLEQLCSVNQGGASRTLQALYNEWRWSDSNAVSDHGAIAERLRAVTRLTVHNETSKLLGRTAILASIGSSAPFIGLFGTVWGIMRSFIAIGQLESVTISVVAPGISEALFATAVGLFAAIPAVLAYNRLAQATADLANRWHTVAEQIEIAISRYYSCRN